MKFDYLPMSTSKRLFTQAEQSGQALLTGGLSRAALVNMVLESFEGSTSQVVVCADYDEAESVRQEFHFMAPDLPIQVLQSFDVSPYSSLYPKPTLSAARMQCLASLLRTNLPQILIVTYRSLLQLTQPVEVFRRHQYELKIGEEIDPDFFELLRLAGYREVETVEKLGDFARRGGIVDVFSTGHLWPVRAELFGDEIESIREFDPQTQLSKAVIDQLRVAPASELLYSETDTEILVKNLRESATETHLNADDMNSLVRSISQQQDFPGREFLLPYFYEKPGQVYEYIADSTLVWWFDKLECDRQTDNYLAELKEEAERSQEDLLRPPVDQLFCPIDKFPLFKKNISLQKILLSDSEDLKSLHWSVSPIKELKSIAEGSNRNQAIGETLRHWLKEGFTIFIGTRNDSQTQRTQYLLERSDLTATILDQEFPEITSGEIFIVQRQLSESVKLNDDKIIFVRESDLLGRKVGKRVESSRDRFQKEAEKLSFGDLKSGDHVVHADHGIGIYEGLKVMSINGIDNEFLQVKYKGTDRLYLPVYKLNRIRKYSGNENLQALDKLGGTSFEKTKIKVKAKLRDIASDLLGLYAKRSQIEREPYPMSEDYVLFESAFPYDETDDQIQAIQDINEDLAAKKPMDRLVCGDVGFGKTEVAMRAAFRVASSGRQVAILAPTTVLTFQHFETLQKRFKNWPFEICAINRFIPKSEQKELLKKLADGKIDIVIGTHRLLSQDVNFKDLGLLILDEEQKFGVSHKEKIRKFKSEVDTLSMSATPIPRTLNLSFVGVRDMSLISTPPVDRIPTRTFVCKFEQDTVRKAILAEVKRGGQVYFIHNRVQSIYGLADELKQLVPEVRIRVGHGQMKEEDLEKTMAGFFKHEFDMLVCTTIVESGMDVPSANTMFIDQAQNYGLSQLYQLRGRVGRSKQRAYCYLLVPGRELDKEAQERLRIIQENTALGSGIRIAHYDLELRGAGDILGYDQAGHVNAVGYELYMELLEQAIYELRDEPDKLRNIEPEIDLKVAAFIPDKYIQDIRTRLYYYKALNDIQSTEDVDKYEDELRDQFGRLPEQVVNLLGLMLVKSQCRFLGVLELKSGPSFISLKMDSHTPLSTEKLIQLATMENKKYSITPDSRLRVRMKETSWSRVFEELEFLTDRC